MYSRPAEPVAAVLMRTRRPRSSRRINPRMLLREHNQWSLVGGGVIELRFNDV